VYKSHGVKDLWEKTVRELRLSIMRVINADCTDYGMHRIRKKKTDVIGEAWPTAHPQSRKPL